jgi:oxepin-CoA hydrolase/3-oxo-5,6-dehydrosuberyl-CoA semialdehyde dehydrogenase
VFGDPALLSLNGADAAVGAFMPPTLFLADDADAADAVHEVEAFGPVATVIGSRDLGHALALANRGKGALVASVFTHDPAVARRAVLEAGAWHGRLYFADRDSGKEATGHGSPLPHLIHGGPGRAGGGEELGGIRGVLHYMQRTAVQGSPDLIAGITRRHVAGARVQPSRTHPFRQRFGELAVGQSIVSDWRSISLDDIEHFAAFTGDKFYAHMDEAAAKANPFFEGRVAHGYLVLAFAAGLFVDPAPGPVLANYGLDQLRFLKPVAPGDAIRVHLTVKDKVPRRDDYGEVRWDVTVENQDETPVATYELLTLNAV